MPSKMVSAGLLAAAAYSASTAFTSIAGAASGQVSVRGIRHTQQQWSKVEEKSATSTAGACVCILGTAVAALGAARAGRRSAVRGSVSRAAMSLKEQLAGTGPRTITVGKDGPSCFSMLIEALDKAGMTSALDAEGITLFAPDDRALTDAGVTVDMVTADVLKLHVVGDVIKAAKFKNQTLTTLGGDATMKKGRMGVLIGGATIKKTDVECANGILHIVSKPIEAV